MPRLPFETLSETLRRGGIAPRHVSRYIAELNDHCDDLTQAAQAKGLSRADAERQALAELGSPDDLAQAMLARDDLKTLSARHPMSFFSFGPAVVLVVSFIAAGVLLVGIALTGQAMFGAQTSADLTPEQLAVLHGLQPVFNAFAWGLKFLLPSALGWLFLRKAMRQQVDLRWVVLGAALIAVIGGATDLTATLPSAPGEKGELQFGFGWYPPFPEYLNTTFRALFNFAVLAPGLWWLARAKAAQA
ncbi:MAG: hypothetical protein JNK21_08975 [Rhodospirillaceae bacterium]|nr:hypothetical protein [Rhodospirillaceae bacterium]